MQILEIQPAQAGARQAVVATTARIAQPPSSTAGIKPSTRAMVPA